MTRTEKHSFSRWRRWHPVCLPIVLVLSGCGGAERRFDLSGTVTHNGRAVPAGYIILKPDETAGNKGPASAVDILNGKYSTRPGDGIVGGPYVANVFGFDGQAYLADGLEIPLGKPLFTTTIKADLPKQNGTHDFVAQAEAARP
jgi:hypothetical protein